MRQPTFVRPSRRPSGRRERVRAWIEVPTRPAERGGGVRTVARYLPVKGPWRNAIETQWGHGTEAIAAPERQGTGQGVKGRVCGDYGCEHVKPLKQKGA